MTIKVKMWLLLCERERFGIGTGSMKGLWGGWRVDLIGTERRTRPSPQPSGSPNRMGREKPIHAQYHDRWHKCYEEI